MNKRTQFFKFFIFTLHIGVYLFIGILVPAFGQTVSTDEIVKNWAEGYEDLNEEEKNLFRKLAKSKLEMPPTKGIFPPPGADSTIMTNPILLDYAQLMKIEKKKLEPMAQALIEQTKSRFLFLETGLSIDKKRFENIDLLKLKLTYSPNKVSTYTMLPESKSRTLITVGGETKIKIGGSLNLGVGKDFGKNLGAEASAEAKQGFLLEWKGNYDIETVDIAAKGRNQPWSRWTFTAEDLIRDDLSFFVVLKVPEEVEKFKIQVDASFINIRIWPLEDTMTKKSLIYVCETIPVGCQMSE